MAVKGSQECSRKTRQYLSTLVLYTTRFQFAIIPLYNNNPSSSSYISPYPNGIPICTPFLSISRAEKNLPLPTQMYFHSSDGVLLQLRFISISIISKMSINHHYLMLKEWHPANKANLTKRYQLEQEVYTSSKLSYVQEKDRKRREIAARHELEKRRERYLFDKVFERILLFYFLDDRDEGWKVNN